MNSYDPAVLVRRMRIAENYRCDHQKRLELGEALRCAVCAFTSRLPETPAFVWVRFDEDVEPVTLELCEICNAAAGGPAVR